MVEDDSFGSIFDLGSIIIIVDKNWISNSETVECNEKTILLG